MTKTKQELITRRKIKSQNRKLKHLVNQKLMTVMLIHILVMTRKVILESLVKLHQDKKEITKNLWQTERLQSLKVLIELHKIQISKRNLARNLKKYYSGLKKSTKSARDAHFKKGAKMDDDNPAAYKPAPGDSKGKTRPSKHTQKFKKMFGEVDEDLSANDIRDWALLPETIEMFKDKYQTDWKIELDNTVAEMLEDISIDETATAAIKKKAEKSGMPAGILRKVYNRGVAAWRTGHRPGTTPQQWGLARVNSFVTKSSGTWGKADKDLAARVRGK